MGTPAIHWFCAVIPWLPGLSQVQTRRISASANLHEPDDLQLNVSFLDDMLPRF